MTKAEARSETLRTTPSVRGLLQRAALLTAAYGVAHLAGWRACTSFLCGTPATEYSPQGTAVRGLLYALAHLGFWILVPALLLAAALALGLRRIGRQRTR